jgi:hypothetical protein
LHVRGQPCISAWTSSLWRARAAQQLCAFRDDMKLFKLTMQARCGAKHALWPPRSIKATDASARRGVCVWLAADLRCRTDKPLDRSAIGTFVQERSVRWPRPPAVASADALAPPAALTGQLGAPIWAGGGRPLLDRPVLNLRHNAPRGSNPPRSRNEALLPSPPAGRASARQTPAAGMPPTKKRKNPALLCDAVL